LVSPFYGYAVVVVDADEFAETPVSRRRGCFVGSTFHEVAVTAEGIDMVVYNVMSLTIENRGKLCFRQGHTRCIHNALA